MRSARIFLSVASMLALIIWTSCDSSGPKRRSETALENLTLGTSKLDLSALIWVAKERGFFADQGLNINFNLYASGHLAIRDLLAGKLDLATATEFASIRGRCRKA